MSEKLDLATRRFCIFLNELAKKEKECGSEDIAQKLFSLQNEVDSKVDIQELAHKFHDIFNAK